MASFRRMELVSREELDRLRQRQVASYDPEMRAASKVEDDINELLNKNGLCRAEDQQVANVATAATAVERCSTCNCSINRRKATATSEVPKLLHYTMYL